MERSSCLTGRGRAGGVGFVPLPERDMRWASVAGLTRLLLGIRQASARAIGCSLVAKARAHPVSAVRT